MAVKSANIGPTGASAVMHGGPATLYSVHWMTATDGRGNIEFQDATSSGGTVRLTLDTPAAAANSNSAGDYTVGGGGIRFNTGIFAKKTNTGGVTVTFATSLQ